MKKTNLFKTILQKVKYEVVESENGQILYEVSKKNFEGKWVKVISTNRLYKAIHFKHNAWLGAINSLGKTSFLFERRRKREKQRIARLAKLDKKK